jgi:hypothetical protein
MALPSVLQRIVEWLRAGYPEGVPEHDYMPLFALLATHLSDEQVRETVDALPTTLAGRADADAIVTELIGRVRTTPPSVDDIARVRAHLQSVGWDFDAAVAATSPAPAAPGSPGAHDNGTQPA